MSHQNEEPLGEVIRQFLQIYGLEPRLEETRLIASWEKVVGKMIAKHTMDLHVHKRTLYVRIDSDALRNELSYAKSLIVKNLNKEAGKEVIDEIVFR